MAKKIEVSGVEKGRKVELPKKASKPFEQWLEAKHLLEELREWSWQQASEGTFTREAMENHIEEMRSRNTRTNELFNYMDTDDFRIDSAYWKAVGAVEKTDSFFGGNSLFF